nr:MAG TPA: hypothetical protein [Caudoviricetes sp.]
MFFNNKKDNPYEIVFSSYTSKFNFYILISSQIIYYMFLCFFGYCII